ncbi:MAG: monovalent cation/H+ antiporter complex subunit F [Lachnospiraceae bacterium]|nr:monovalent cation/H+ antiporter complex subunit F [Lachnospiraceae bacterium]
MTVLENMTLLEGCSRYFLIGALLLLIVLVLLSLIRAVRGPSVSDRIVAINMINTMVTVMIAIMAVILKEGYLMDICLIYAMIGFLAVVVLTKVYTDSRTAKKDSEKTDAEKGSGEHADGV